jgi:hypothetical protein
MLNNAFVRKNALKLAEQLLSDATLTDEARVSKAYKRVLGRLPSDTEIAGAISYIREIESVSDLIFELQLKSNAAASNAVASAPSEANSSSVAAIAPTTSNSDDVKPNAKTETGELLSAASTTSASDADQPSPSWDQGGLEIELSFSFKLKSSGKAIVDAKATDTQANRDILKSAVAPANSKETEAVSADAKPATSATATAQAVSVPASVATAVTTSTTGAAPAGEPKKPAPPIDPDQIVVVEPPLQEELVQARSPREAAWASFAHALLGSAEFRYVK